jgi:murein DD-endopeptidase MepM/ murein hydrolase activator NlpD
MSRILPVARVAATPVASIIILTALAGPGIAAPDGSWPLDPRPVIVSDFDPPEDPWGRGHRGVDLGGRVGQPVRAALSGTVGFAGRIAGRGVLVVDHGRTRTTYEPVTALVAVGTPVARGAVVGRLELAGSHCLPSACLHWGWRRGEAYLDPLNLLGAVPVRLLPLDDAGMAGKRLGQTHRPASRPPAAEIPPAAAAAALRAVDRVLIRFAAWWPAAGPG